MPARVDLNQETRVKLMNNADVLKILNKVGEDFGWLMGKVGSKQEKEKGY